MSRRNVRRVPFHLDASGVKNLCHAELAAILRGADAMISRGGRGQLSKLLKGSREANILEHHLDLCPSHGYYRALSLEEILRRIDWAIEHEYLRVDYEYRLPVLFFTEAGWAIEMETMAAELLRGFEARLATGPPFDLSDLKDRNRPMILLLLDKLEASARPDFIPLLESWAGIEFAKVRARINRVIQTLRAISIAAIFTIQPQRSNT
ncbi:MAG TPA: RQC-minor-1 family DNA-binding protein [Thermoanaerobaculia bacterium]|nr:RQC-minor-1 family DNA-binding protein [Thermoanaerobaculia bacterium]